MSPRLPEGATWPLEALDEALGHLGRRTGEPAPAPPSEDDDDALARWLARVAGSAGLDLQQVAARSVDVDDILIRSAPALLALPVRDGEAPRFAVLLRSGRRTVRLLRRNLRGMRVRTERLAEILRSGAEERHAEVAELAVAQLPSHRRAAARRVIRSELAAAERVGDCWLLRTPPERSIRGELREFRLGLAAAAWVASHAVAYGMWVASWGMIGRGALAGRLEPGWLLAWAAILVSMAPLRALTVWLQGLIAVRAGVILKQRLLVGALRMSPDDIRTRGVGTLLGRVEESAALERMALSGGLSAVLSGVEWAMATAVLWSAGASLHAALGAVWFLGIALFARRMRRDRVRWTRARIDATHGLVEKLLGHRTRTVQELPEDRHTDEDEALARYATVSRRADGSALALGALTAGWIPAGIVALTPSFVAGTATVSSLAVSIGGVLLIGRSLDGLARGFADLVEASIAWEQVRDVMVASYQGQTRPAPEASAVPAPDAADPVLEARGLAYRYASAPRAALAAADFRIGRRDRVLVQGTSGGGKSTLSSMILGLRAPTAGTLLLDGLDRSVWGEEGWRERITGAPQFHENHVLAGTLAFNLLLGRRWPPRPEDLDDAERVCRELGLGPLIERMPGGLQQLVGETGWQLSHGERSRVFLARALLQGGALLVLDESFGALDPQSVEWCLHRADRFPGALVVVAHP